MSEPYSIFDRLVVWRNPRLARDSLMQKGAASALKLIDTLTTDGIKTDLTWNNLSGYNYYLLMFFGTSWSDGDFDGTVLQFGHGGVIDTTNEHYPNGGTANVAGIDFPNVDVNGTFYVVLIAGALSTAADKLISSPANTSTPTNPAAIVHKSGSWLNTATITDINLTLDAASPTAFPAGGTVSLYGIAS